MKGEINHVNDVNMLREWLQKQPHLPQNIHDLLLKRFIHASNGSIEMGKNLLELFYTIRSQAPEIFDNRDPTEKSLQVIIENIDFLPLPKLTDDKCKIFLYRLRSSDIEKYDFINGLKAFFLFSDVRMTIDEEMPFGDIPIFDMNHFTLKHLTKVVLPVLKKYMVYTQEAHPIRLKEIHLVNVPPYLDRCMAILRPFMKNEVIHSHLPNSETLYNYIPKDILPEEYGGKIGSCTEIKKFWYEKLMEHKDYLLDGKRWKVDESKRQNKAGKKDFFGMEGSFRTLNID